MHDEGRKKSDIRKGDLYALLDADGRGEKGIAQRSKGTSSKTSTYKKGKDKASLIYRSPQKKD